MSYHCLRSLTSYEPKHVLFDASLHRHWLPVFKLKSRFASSSRDAFQLLPQFLIHLCHGFVLFLLWFFSLTNFIGRRSIFGGLH